MPSPRHLFSELWSPVLYLASRDGEPLGRQSPRSPVAVVDNVVLRLDAYSSLGLAITDVQRSLSYEVYSANTLEFIKRQTSRRKVFSGTFLELYLNYLPVLRAYFGVTCSLIYL